MTEPDSEHRQEGYPKVGRRSGLPRATRTRPTASRIESGDPPYEARCPPPEPRTRTAAAEGAATVRRKTDQIFLKRMNRVLSGGIVTGTASVGLIGRTPSGICAVSVTNVTS